MANNKLDITIETKELVHALSFASSVVEKRNVITELGNIKLSAKGSSLEIVATDMDLYLSQHIGAQVTSEGELTVSTQTLTDVVRKIPDKEIKLKQASDSNSLELTGAHCHFSLLTLPVDQFPVMDEVKAESILKIPAREFARIIDYTQFSMSTEETRYNLNGIYLHVKGDQLFAAATDGHRLSLAGVTIGKEAKEFGIILPRKTVQEILKIVKDPKNIQSDIQLQLGTNKVKFICNNLIMVSKLIDGTFPEYAAFIPQGNPHKLTINTKLLASAIDRVATVTVDKFRAIKMTLTDNAIEITASGEARGAAKEQVLYSKEQDNLCNFEGSDITIGFNPKYLSDVLSAVKQEQVEFYFNDPFSPTLIKISENPQDNFVIMPVKV